MIFFFFAVYNTTFSGINSQLLMLSYFYLKGERHAVSVSPTPVSVHGVNLPRLASILLHTSQNIPMESVGTGMTGKESCGMNSPVHFV